MNDSTSYFGLAIALFLPWVMGATWMRIFFRRSGNWNWPFILGYGYLVGVFTTTIVIRAYDAIGFTLSFYPIAGIITIVTLSGCLILLRQINITPLNSTSRNDWVNLILWQKLVIGFLLTFITIRFSSILLEIIWRPLYPWDAWMNWTVKSKVWFVSGALVSYISPNEWLKEGINSGYTLGNWKAWKYPETIPLIQLWQAMGIGVWNDSLINTPWLLCTSALGLAFYGQARLLSLRILPCIIGTYLIVNLPYLNVHTALGGYADLWLATTFSLSVFSLANYQLTNDKRHLYIAILFALLCSIIKLPGIIFTLIVMISIALTTINKKKAVLRISIILTLLAIIIFFHGIEVDIHGIGHIAITTNQISIPHFGQYSIKYYPVWHSFSNSLLFSVNWNIIFHISFITIIVALTKKHSPKLLLLRFFTVLIIVIGLYYFLFFFTQYHHSAINQTTLNRVILYSIPYLVFINLLIYGALTSLQDKTVNSSN